ncbi:hypothetical protein IWX49DRAFT_105021 [Phyllosticta citricarpa]
MPFTSDAEKAPCWAGEVGELNVTVVTLCEVCAQRVHSGSTRLTLLALGSLLLGLRAITLMLGQYLREIVDVKQLTYLLVRLVIVIPVIAEVVFLLVVLILEFALVVVIHLLKLESLAGEPVNGARNELLLNVLAELVVELEALLNVRRDLVIVFARSLGWRKEVEERLGGNRLLDDAGLLGV